jgi:hypothetical protein
MKTLFKSSLFFTIVFIFSIITVRAAETGQYYLLRIYHIKNTEQEKMLDDYLQNAYKPAIKRLYNEPVGVFKTLESDTDRRIYVLTIFTKWSKLEDFNKKLAADEQYQRDGSAYINAEWNNAPYTRFEDIILHAFPHWLTAAFPSTLSAPKSERIYELRSYEGPTEKYYRNKVKMFNDGNETVIFNRLNFNAVFYAEVLVGGHEPNLMYMTTFNNMADREAHWKAFNNDPEWKALVTKPEYQHNVSKAVILYLHPAEYSDF